RGAGRADPYPSGGGICAGGLRPALCRMCCCDPASIKGFHSCCAGSSHLSLLVQRKATKRRPGLSALKRKSSQGMKQSFHSCCAGASTPFFARAKKGGPKKALPDASRCDGTASVP